MKMNDILFNRLKKEFVGTQFDLWHNAEKLYNIMTEYVDNSNYDLGYRYDRQTITITYKRHSLLEVHLKKKQDKYCKTYYSNKMYEWVISDLTCLIMSKNGEEIDLRQRLDEINETILANNQKHLEEINVGAKLYRAILHEFKEWTDKDIQEQLHFLENHFSECKTQYNKDYSYYDRGLRKWKDYQVKLNYAYLTF